VIKTFDHDFPSFASGVVIPHGLYDVKRNDGHVNLGTSHDTGEFACDSIERWWESQGEAHYPRAGSILLLCDGGGSTPSVINTSSSPTLIPSASARPERRRCNGVRS
jgi:hypothetical protein